MLSRSMPLLMQMVRLPKMVSSFENVTIASIFFARAFLNNLSI